MNENLILQDIRNLDIEINSFKARMGSAGGMAAQQSKLDTFIRSRERAVRDLDALKRGAAA
jgi:hypothetical protein